MTIREMAFFSYPQSVRYAMGLLVAGWISLLTFIFHINVNFPGQISGNYTGRTAIIGLGICYCVLKIKPWARKLCIFFNLGVIGINLAFLYARLAALGLASPGLSGHALLNIVLFSLCTYFLLVKSTATFFHARLPEDAGEKGGKAL